MWNQAPTDRPRSASDSTSCSTPVSLLASITETIFGLALITALAELVAGGWFLHRCLLPTVRTLSGGAKRVAAAGIRRTSRIEVIARPSLLTRLLAAIDAVIDPARRLDRFIASAWKVRRQRKGEVA